MDLHRQFGQMSYNSYKMTETFVMFMNMSFSVNNNILFDLQHLFFARPSLEKLANSGRLFCYANGKNVLCLIFLLKEKFVTNNSQRISLMIIILHKKFFPGTLLYKLSTRPLVKYLQS